MISARQHTLILALILFWVAVSIGLLVVAYGGFLDDWLAGNTLCGTGVNNDYAECGPGEVQLAMKIVGWVGLAAAPLEVLFVSRLAGRGAAAPA